MLTRSDGADRRRRASPSSRAGGRGTVRTFVSPDIATCGDCLAELFDPADRRARYPFTNCTNCGPRFTITLSLPYDRPNTTMRGFALCEACASEYHDPADRRFHAQPIACADCGPRLWLEHSAGSDPVVGSDAAIAAAQAALARGEIVADQGSRRVPPGLRRTLRRRGERLRTRKQRLQKPFAVMARDLDVRPHAGPYRLGGSGAPHIGPATHRPPAPAHDPAEAVISASVAPGNPRLGVLLPYTPLHHLLFAPVPGSVPGPRCPTCW